MLAMDEVQRIRDLYYHQGITNVSEISRITGYNRKTVVKYLDQEDFSPPPPVPKDEMGHSSKLDPYKPLIDSWLIGDKKAPRKQRHTAKRVYRRLEKEVAGFSCSYRTVANYVSERKKALNLKKQDGYIPLNHNPGEGQADFGTADFVENGRRYYEAKYLVVSFPYSNGGYLQLNYGENMECLLEGLVAVFEHIGGVPTEIWFDNTKTIVTQIIKGGGRTVNQYVQFQLNPVMTINKNWIARARLKYYTDMDRATNATNQVPFFGQDSGFILDRMWAQGNYKNLTIQLGKIYHDSPYDGPSGGMVLGNRVSGGIVTFGNKLKATLGAGRLARDANAGRANTTDSIQFIELGGDFNDKGEYVTPVQKAFLCDGERFIGSLPEFNMRGSLFDLFGKDFIGVGSDKPVFNDYQLIARMSYSGKE